MTFPVVAVSRTHREQVIRTAGLRTPREQVIRTAGSRTPLEQVIRAVSSRTPREQDIRAVSLWIIQLRVFRQMPQEQSFRQRQTAFRSPRLRKPRILSRTPL